MEVRGRWPTDGRSGAQQTGSIIDSLLNTLDFWLFTGQWNIQQLRVVEDGDARLQGDVCRGETLVNERLDLRICQQKKVGG